MATLSDTQRLILAAACQRPDRRVLPLPERLKGAAARKVVASLLAKGLVQEIDARAGDPVWRDAGAGHGLTLVATDAAFQALGLATAATTAATRRKAAPTAPTGAAGRTPRADSKQARLVAMLRRPEGASLAEIVAAFGWQPHTVRGAIAGALKKTLGLAVTSAKTEGRGRAYRIA
jgi:hypothetical protein